MEQENFDALEKAIEAGQAKTSKRMEALELKLKETQETALEASLRANRLQIFGGGGDVEHERKQFSAALRSYARKGDETELKAMSVGSDVDGGYLVPSVLAMTMSAKAFEISPLRQFARVVQIGTDKFEEPVDNTEAGGSWVGETSSRPVTDSPTVGKLTIFAREQYASPAVSQQLLEDSQFDIAQWLGDKITNKFLRDEASAFISGDGVARPWGITTQSSIVTTSDATRAWGALQYIPTGQSAGFITPTTSASPADCLIDTVYSMKATYRGGARWYLNSSTAAAVRKFRDPEGRFIWTDSLIAGQPPTLLGYPVTLAEDMPTLAADSYSIMFANLAVGYTIVDRVGLSILRDPYTSKPNVLLYARRRVGGMVSNSEAIKLVRAST